MHKTEQRIDRSVTETTKATPSGETLSSPEDGTTMQAIVQRAYASADSLGLATIDRPTIAEDEVLIEVHAAGLDRGTWHLMTGTPYLIRLAGFGLTKPKQAVPGLDVSGRVVAVGSTVTRFAPGDDVFGIAQGSFAEYAAAKETKLAHIPANTTFEQASVATVSAITALQALTDVGKLQSGQSVLIIGASGGVGSYAIQLAKALGAEVTGVASTAKLDLVRSLGADHVIDYTTDDFVDAGRGYDLILDIGGRNSIARLRRALAQRGTLVIVGGEGGDKFTGGLGRQLRALLLSPFVSQRLTMFVSTEHHSMIERVAAFIESGEVIPSIGQRFSLADTADAIQQMEAGVLKGKSVIVVRTAAADREINRGVDR
jgi:NADPH:quinone reductase-like Zn-dependent oxidoreductase